MFEEPDVLFLRGFAERLREALPVARVRFARLYDRHQFFFHLGDGQELKVEFTRYPFKPLDEPQIRDGLRIDSVRDIAANKLMAMLDRFDPKDFVDLFFILHKKKLEDIRRDTETKFGLTVDSVFLGGELAKVRRIAALPKMIKPLTPEALKAFFAARARELAREIFKE